MVQTLRAYCILYVITIKCIKPWPKDYTFLSTFAIHLYCKNRAINYVVAKRLDLSLYNLFDSPT